MVAIGGIIAVSQPLTTYATENPPTKSMYKGAKPGVQNDTGSRR